LEDVIAFSRASTSLYAILIKPAVYGPKFLRAFSSLENEIIVVVLP
jgi:hypothetical protein